MEKPLNFRFLKYRSINMNSHVILKNLRELEEIHIYMKNLKVFGQGIGFGSLRRSVCAVKF
jgi:hypothetical protein